MNKFVGAAAALILAGVAVPAAAAVNDTSASSSATAKIIRPISVTAGPALAFGTIVRPSAGTSTVVVSSGGARSITGGGDAVALASTSAAAAEFTVGGEGAQAITVHVPLTFDLVNQTGGGEHLTVSTTNSQFANNGTGDYVTTLGGSLGSDAPGLLVKVGGSFSVTPTTSTGDFQGTLTVSAKYN